MFLPRNIFKLKKTKQKNEIKKLNSSLLLTTFYLKKYSEIKKEEISFKKNCVYAKDLKWFLNI